MSDLTSEDATLAKARTLGVTLPSFRQADYPALFCSWADRVAQAYIAHQRQQLTDADLDECDKQLGIPASRVKPKSLAPAMRLIALAGVHADPLAAIVSAIGAAS